MNTPTGLVLGIDGGGTKTVAWLARCDFTDHRTAISNTIETIGRGRAGSSNVRRVGFETALGNLDRAVEDAFADAEIPRVPVDRACLALAGAGRNTEQQRIRSWANQRQLANRLAVVDDALPVLYAAAEDGIGIALIAGTGSLALGRNAEGQTARCGGWGSLLGDEGSGYQISLSALRAAVRADDGRGPTTQLHQRLLEHHGITTASELIPILYTDSNNRVAIASLAPLVFEVASSGDPVAMQILDQASTDLAEMVHTLVDRLGMSNHPCALAGTGSVLIHQPAFTQSVRDKLARTGTETTFRAIPESVVGTLVIAVGLTTTH
ncbi:N-acetylglucosamine kinase [Rhodopirellula sp. P2]|uniref:N-acetylglucosamine kinase n=1 Tax=Rhodopirellula sp. P2 TaxID=2127060 RepID=UPI002368D665|nr:BadF/BadG/BcrA/BcrD ATPase family protein [Rhodopirellula sp. P2]WDQ18580.1 BadF/BadG/BcrA/BcrD ATPase family protein [Rhodopirellula sp. P2]